jgi:choice-of-anchor B domain-containing protein
MLHLETRHFKFRTFISALVLSLMLIPAQAQLNINFLGQLNYSQDLSDIWGWNDTINNKEYALVGVFNGFSIVDVTNPTSPFEVQFFPGANSTWRDIKVWDHYAYVTNESSGGLLIVDMSGTPGSFNSVNWTGGSLGLSSAHNVFIDEFGYAYIVGANIGVGGALFLNLNIDPMNPVHEGTYDVRYIHDCYVRGDTMWAAEISDGILSVVDVSDKTAPVVLATQATSSDFTHNVWVNDGGTHAFTTDERENAFIDAYDVSDLTDIQRVDMWQSSPGSNVIPHNTFVRGNFIITSYYRDGVTINDITFPDNMVLTGEYDTSPLSGGGFNGCWGVYPYPNSGNIFATDIEQGLFILGPTYVQACYLEGLVTDSITGMPINDANVEIIAPDADLANSDIFGNYSSGVLTAGTYSVQFSKVGYESKTISGVSLTNGSITSQDAELAPLASIAFSATVVDSLSGIGVPFAKVLLESDLLGSFAATCDADGDFSIASVFEGEYTLYAGTWAYQTKAFGAFAVNSLSSGTVLEINRGYYDDFLFNYNWSSAGTSSTGRWERDDPIGTDFFGAQSNPEDDDNDDFGVEALITGNDGGGAGTDDIDDGASIVVSPTFDLSTYGDPHISFARWFYNDGGSGAPNDSLVIRLINGSDEATALIITDGDPFESSWRNQDIRILDHLSSLGSDMRFEARAVDTDPGHLVEAGLDHWFIYDAAAENPPVAAIASEGFCGFEDIQFLDLSSNFPNSWYWTFDSGTPAISTDANPVVDFPGPGSYNVTLVVYSPAGTSTTNLTVELTDPIDLTLSSSASSGSDGTASVSISGGASPYNILWDDASGQTTDVASGLSPGIYSVTVTDANGCSQTASVVVSSIQGILENEFLSGVSVLPNPFANQVEIQYQWLQQQDLQYVVWDVLGRQVDGGVLAASSNSLKLGADWPGGQYQLTIYDQDRILGSLALIKTDSK